MCNKLKVQILKKYTTMCHICFVGVSAEALGLVMPLDKQAELLSCGHVYTVCARGMVRSLMIALILGQNQTYIYCQAKLKISTNKPFNKIPV